MNVSKRNYPAMLLEGTFFFTGMAFIDVNAVIPVFIFTYTGSMLLAGLATTISLATSIVTQTLLGPHIHRIRNMPRFITLVMSAYRPLPFLIIPVLFSGLNPWLIAVIFLVIYAMIWAGDGLTVVPWSDLFGRTIPSVKRGSLLGLQQLFGGFGALGAGYIVKITLDHPQLSNDWRYSIIFGCSGLAMTLSCLAMMQTRDVSRVEAMEDPRPSTYYRQLPKHFKDHPLFRSLAWIRILASVTTMIAPLLILFCQERFILSASEVSTLVYIQIIGSLAGGVFWGRICSRLGSHRAIFTSQALGFLVAMVSLAFRLIAPSTFPVHFIWPLIFINGLNMASWIGFLNYTIDIVDEKRRTIYLLLSNLITFPFTVLPFLSGILAQTVDFLPLFLVAALASVIAAIRARHLPGPAVIPKVLHRQSVDEEAS